MEFNSIGTNANKFNFGLSSSNDFYLKINIDSLDITYKQCDDFGIIFKPFLEVGVTGQELSKISTIEEEKLNLSYSSISNEGESSRYDKLKSFISSTSQQQGNKDKKFTFKTVRKGLTIRLKYSK
jgi:hypothetical protein